MLTTSDKKLALASSHFFSSAAGAAAPAVFAELFNLLKTARLMQSTTTSPGAVNAAPLPLQVKALGVRDPKAAVMFVRRTCSKKMAFTYALPRWLPTDQPKPWIYGTKILS